MTDRFGIRADGHPVTRITLCNGALTARILTLGAIVQDLRLDGVPYPLVLGSDSLMPYLGAMQYCGAMVGRCANRVAQGQFTLDGQTYQLSRNAQGHCLHGGAQGMSAQIWTITAQRTDQVTLHLSLPDGHMGFPGRLDVQLCIALIDQALEFDIRAKCDRATLCNLSHHGFFILDDSGSIAGHSLQVAAPNYLPVDPTQVPTGEIATVAGTAFDYRTPRDLKGIALDHNFCLSAARVAPRAVARLCSRRSCLVMEMQTTEPGLQVYTANHLPKPGICGLEGRQYARHAGIALEAQVWPDAANHSGFPSAVLRPGALYHQQTRYSFHRDGWA